VQKIHNNSHRHYSLICPSDCTPVLIFKMGQTFSGPKSPSPSGSKKNVTLTTRPAENEMLRIIECPVCQEIPFPPIFQCVTGHSICKNCRTKLKECPMCKEVITDTRNYTVETLVQNYKHVCSYSPAGCDVVQTGDLIENHLSVCQYKPRPCPLKGHLNCTEMFLQLPGYREHFQIAHTISAFVGGTVAMKYKIEIEALKAGGVGRETLWCWRNLVEFDGNTFLIVLTLAKNSQSVYWAIVCLGGDKEAEKYEAEVALTAEKVHRIQLIWKFPVCSIFKGIKQAEAEANDIFQPSCTFSTFKKFTKPFNEDESKCVITVKYDIRKFKA